MRWFITGATGFIGGHMCARLRALGHEVCGLVRSAGKAESLRRLGCRVIPGDLDTLADPGFTIPAADYVLHLAGVVSANSPGEYDAINRGAVRTLVDCLERQQWQPRRLLFASSLAAGGSSRPDGVPLTEEAPPSPVDPYGEAKAAAEQLIRACPFPATIFRPPLVLGPGDRATLALFNAASRGLGFGVLGQDQPLSFIFIADLVEAVVAMASQERAAGRTYYLSGPEHASADALWLALGEAFGRRVAVLRLPRQLLWLASRAAIGGAWLFGFNNPLDDKQYRQIVAPAFVCSSARLQEETGWAPKVGLDEAVKLSLQGYRAAGWL